LQEAFDARQPLENELVAGIELDARLTIHALCVQFRTQTTLWPAAIATGLAATTDLAGDGGAASRVVERVSRIPHGSGVSVVSVLRVVARGVCVVDYAFGPGWSGRLFV